MTVHRCRRVTRDTFVRGAVRDAARYAAMLAVAVVLSILPAGCKSLAEPSVKPDAVEIGADGKFVSKYFNFSLALPPSWQVASKETTERTNEVGSKAVAGDDQALKAAVEASKQTTFQLLLVSEHPVGAAVEFNPNLVAIAEKVSHVPGVASGKEYLFHTTKLLERSQMKIKLVQEARPVTLGGVEFHRADFEIANPGMNVIQYYYAARRGDFALAFVLSGGSPEQMAKLEEVLGSIRFEAPR